MLVIIDRFSAVIIGCIFKFISILPFRTVSHRLASQECGYLRDTDFSTGFQISTYLNRGRVS